MDPDSEFDWDDFEMTLKMGEALFSRLRIPELFWIEHFDYLAGKGFALRSRYRPGGGQLSATESISFHNVVDAIQLKDNRKVCIKVMPIQEAKDFHKLSQDLASQAGNHTVPLLIEEPIAVPGDRFKELVVMPCLREFDSPQFKTCGEILEAVKQFIEGIECMHRNNMAHRDIRPGNMMMDGSTLIPKGWHFPLPMTQDGETRIESFPRSYAKPIYYLIDFEHLFVVNNATGLPLATQKVGKYDAPEFSNLPPGYDARKLDVYQLGTAFQKSLLQFYDGINRLEPLITRMTARCPSDRPFSSEALEELARIIKDADPDHPVSPKEGIIILNDSIPLSPPLAPEAEVTKLVGEDAPDN